MTPVATSLPPPRTFQMIHNPLWFFPTRLHLRQKTPPSKRFPPCFSCFVSATGPLSFPKYLPITANHLSTSLISTQLSFNPFKYQEFRLNYQAVSFISFIVVYCLIMAPRSQTQGKAPRTCRTKAQIEEDLRLFGAGLPSGSRPTAAEVKRSRLAAQDQSNHASSAASSKILRDSPPFDLVDCQTIIAYLSKPNL